MDRTILHCDLNGFYASVEIRERPDLWEKPVAVCGDLESRHGIILAKNEMAKGFGVKTAETIWQARQKCPGLVLLPAHHDQYRLWSKRVNAIYERYTDLVEPFGIDESWLDITGSMHLFGGDAKDIADQIRAVVRAETGLTISVGVSFNKVFAKLGSDLKKPDATTVIARADVPEKVWPLPVTDLLFVGRPRPRSSGTTGSAPSGTWRPSAGSPWSASWASWGDSSTTTPPVWSTAGSPEPGRPRPPSRWATASPSGGIWWAGPTSAPG